MTEPPCACGRTLKLVGAGGAVIVVVAPATLLGGPSPARFVASTRNSYARRGSRYAATNEQHVPIGSDIRVQFAVPANRYSTQ
jgi:hypothetical protein